MDERLSGLDGLVLDLDGVVYRGNEVLPGAVAAIDDLRVRGVRVLFCTNNSHSTVAQYVRKLTAMGIEVSNDLILTSAVVLGDVLSSRSPRPRRAFVIGGDGITEALEGAGIIISDGDDVDLVAVGWDPSFSYARLRDACFALQSGARLIATNDDVTFPAEGGRLWPGAGSILAAVEVASGIKAEVVGKPHRPMMESAAARLAPASRIAVVGDRFETDLKGGVEMGWPTVLVLSGVTSVERARSLEPAPDLIVDDLAELVKVLFV